MFFISCHEFHKYLLNACYGLLGAEDIAIRMDKIPVLWKAPAVGWESVLWKDFLLPFAARITTPNLVALDDSSHYLLMFCNLERLSGVAQLCGMCICWSLLGCCIHLGRCP